MCSMITQTVPISASAALSHRHLFAVLVPLFVYFILLSYVPLPNGLIFSGMGDTLTLVTARYNVLGTFILGCLSGFGSVTTAWGYFPLSCGKNTRHVDHSSDSFCLTNLSKCRKIPTRAELDQKEQGLTRVRADIANKRNDLTSLKAREASQTEVGDQSPNLCDPESYFSYFQGYSKAILAESCYNELSR